MPIIGSRGAWQGAERLDEEARRVVQRAESMAAAYGLRQATPDVLLRALLEERDGIPPRALTAIGVDVDAMRASLDAGLKHDAPLGGRSALDPDTREAIVLGTNEARRDGLDQAGAGHLLLGLLEARAGKGVRSLVRQGASIATVRALVQELGEGGDESGAEGALFRASFPRFLAQIGGERACPNCGASLHGSFRYCYNCGVSQLG